jgi:hypothetical protein
LPILEVKSGDWTGRVQFADCDGIWGVLEGNVMATVTVPNVTGAGDAAQTTPVSASVAANHRPRR